MARAPKKTTGTAVANWQSEMAKSAAKAAEMEKSTSGGRFFSMKAGQLKFDDVAMPGNMMACVILHGVYENVYYAGKYDPDNKAPPACFAFWHPDDEEEMQPHPDVDTEDCFTRQSDACEGCPQNEWGSAEVGKGKACSNRRRLALIPAGIYKSLGKNKGFDLEMFNAEEDFKKSDLAFMKLPVMSVKGYSAFTREVTEQLGKPLWAVYTNISVEADERSQFRVNFELIDEIPDDLMGIIFKRHTAAKDETAFPYRPPSDDEDAAPVKNTAAKKLAGKTPAKRSRVKK